MLVQYQGTVIFFQGVNRSMFRSNIAEGKFSRISENSQLLEEMLISVAFSCILVLIVVSPVRQLQNTKRRSWCQV